MPVTHTLDHAARAFDRLLEQLKEIDDWRKLLAALNVQTQALEDALYDLLTKRALDTAEGEQLDVIGRLLAEPRDGASDDDYVTRLTAKICVLHSSGTAPELLHIFKLLLPDNTLRFTAIGGAGFTLDLGAIDTAFLAIYQRFIREAKSAGVNAQLVYHDGEDFTDAFAFSDNPDPEVTVNDPDVGFSDETGTVGGRLAGITT